MSKASSQSSDEELDLHLNPSTIRMSEHYTAETKAETKGSRTHRRDAQQVAAVRSEGFRTHKSVRKQEFTLHLMEAMLDASSQKR